MKPKFEELIKDTKLLIASLEVYHKKWSSKPIETDLTLEEKIRLNEIYLELCRYSIVRVPNTFIEKSTITKFPK